MNLNRTTLQPEVVLYLSSSLLQKNAVQCKILSLSHYQDNSHLDNCHLG